MSDSDILKSMDTKLTVILKLLALNVAKGRTFSEQIEMLHNAGMSPSEIASCLGKTSNNVRVALHSLRKKGDKKNG